MKKKILYLDMDGVIANFDKMVHDINPELSKIEDYDERSAIIDQIAIENSDMFEHLEPMEGAIEAVNKLFDLYDVYFLSTPMYEVPNSYKGKRIWLEKHFGEKAKKRLTLTHRKDLSIGDFLVDDRLKNGAGEFTGKHIHFATAEFPNWESTYKYLYDNHL